MIWLLVIIVPLIVFYLAYKNNLCYQISSYFVLTLLSILLTIWFCGIVSSHIDYEQIESFEREIVNIRQGTQSELYGGGNLLGWSVNAESIHQYVIMEKFDNGTMKRRFLKQSDTYIVETNETPKVIYKQFKKAYSKIRHFPTLWNKLDTHYNKDGATIYVPEGTVAVDFNEL